MWGKSSAVRVFRSKVQTEEDWDAEITEEGKKESMIRKRTSWRKEEFISQKCFYSRSNSIDSLFLSNGGKALTLLVINCPKRAFPRSLRTDECMKQMEKHGRQLIY